MILLRSYKIVHQGAKVVDLVNRNIVGMNIISHVDDNLIARDFEDGTKIKVKM